MSWHHSAQCVEVSVQPRLLPGRRERRFWWESGLRRQKAKTQLYDRAIDLLVCVSSIQTDIRVRPIPVSGIGRYLRVSVSSDTYFSIGADTSSSFTCLNSQHSCMHAYSFKPIDWSHCKKYTPAVLPIAASTPQFMTLTMLCFETYIRYAQYM